MGLRPGSFASEGAWATRGFLAKLVNRECYPRAYAAATTNGIDIHRAKIV